MKYFKHNQFNLDKLIQRKRSGGLTIGLALPVLNEEETLGKVIKTVNRCKELLDQVIVIDSGSTDKSRKVASALGVPVISDSESARDLKYILRRGKGWNLWASLYYLKTDIIIWIDSDIQNIDERFIIGTVGPLIIDSKLKFVKGYYHRPKGDARVTEIMVRPFINYFFPKAKDFIQPLSGEYAGHREFLESIDFYSGYSVEVAILIQAVCRLKPREIAQAYLGTRIHELQDVQSLGRMSGSILYTLLNIAEKEGIIKLETNIRGLLRQFHSDDGVQFKASDMMVKDELLSAIVNNKIYAKRFKRPRSNT